LPSIDTVIYTLKEDRDNLVVMNDLANNMKYESKHIEAKLQSYNEMISLLESYAQILDTIYSRGIQN
jgi:hypothetical protein